MQVLHHRRVLLLTEEYPPALGGIQNYLSQLMGQLSPAHTFVIAQSQQGATEWDKEQQYKVLRVNMRGGFFPRWRPAYRALEKAVKEFKPEVIVCGKALFEGRAALKIWRKCRIPFVVMTYGMEVNTWLKNWKTRRDLLRVCEGAARVFVINEETKKAIEQSLNDNIKVRPLRGRTLMRDDVGNKFVKMYPGADDFFGQKIIVATEIASLRSQRRPTIVSVCRLVHRKGIDIVINAVNEIRKTLPNIEYQIIGDGPERNNLEKQASELGLQNNVKFLGKLTNEKIREQLQKADLFVMTPRNEAGNMEGFGIVYLEAALAGLCAVGSKSGGVPEAILDGQTGLLVNENDVQDTAEKIMCLLQDELLRKKMAGNAQERARKDFSWQSRAVLFRGAIEGIIKETDE